MDELNPKITTSQISMLQQYQLREPSIKNTFDLSDSDYVYNCLKKLSYKQYKYLNYLYSWKKYGKVSEILWHAGLKRISEKLIK